MNAQLIETLIEALKWSPDNPVLREQVAELLINEGRGAEAVPYLQGINTEWALYLLAKGYYMADDALKTAATIQKIPSYEQKGAPLLLLAQAVFQLGHHHEADGYYQRALTLDPTLKDDSFETKLFPTCPSIQGVEQPDPTDHELTEPLVEGVEYDQADDTFEEFLEKPDLTFDGVGGLESVKETIRLKIIYPFQNPELFAEYGKTAGGGLIFYGPPGCGKTYLARATAGECQARFINLGINDILDMYIGESEKNLHRIFEMARRHRPSVIFIDELDALAAARSQSDSRSMRSLTNQFLTELDGLASENDNILVVGATNAPWYIDPAFKRPGRFDQTLFIPPPDEQARLEIFKVHLEGKPIEALNWAELAKKSERFSGADIKAVCALATEKVLQHALKTGSKHPIGQKHLLEALKQLKPSTVEWFETAKNYAMYSNQGGQYDDILDYLNPKKK